MRGYVCKQTEASFTRGWGGCTALSDLQGPQRQRSVHPDNQFPAGQKKKARPEERDGKRGAGQAKNKKRETIVRLESLKWIKFKLCFYTLAKMTLHRITKTAHVTT